MTTANFLVIGYGNMGSLHVNVLKSLIPEATFHIIDKEDVELPTHCKKIEIRSIKDVNEYTGIIISTHTDSHLEYYEKLSDFKNLIFIEKPLINNIEDLYNFKNLNKKNIFCGFIETHNNLFTIAKKNITDDPFYIQVERISPQIDPSRLKDDVAFDLTIHDISVALEHFIEYQNIISSKSINIVKNSFGLYEMNNLKINTENCIVNFSSSRLGQKKIRNWKIFTKNEQINIDLIKKEILVTRKNNVVKLENNQLIQDFYEKVIIDTESNPAKAQMIEYLKCLQNNSSQYNYKNSIHSHEILLNDK